MELDFRLGWDIVMLFWASYGLRKAPLKLRHFDALTWAVRVHHNKAMGYESDDAKEECDGCTGVLWCTLLAG